MPVKIEVWMCPYCFEDFHNTCISAFDACVLHEKTCPARIRKTYIRGLPVEWSTDLMGLEKTEKGG